MKKITKIFYAAAVSSVLLGSCKKFEEMNNDPLAANADQVQVEYFINGSIIGAQMDPHIAERVFVLYWLTAGGMQQSGGISSGGYNDGWSSDYYGGSYMSGWLNQINTAIQVAEQKIAAGTAKSYTSNLMQVARIWRAYLMSELADTFGPIPVDGFQGKNPAFSDLKTVYYFLLSELKNAVASLDLAVAVPQDVAKHDPAYSYNFTKWVKYGNSLRMRLAMRLSEVDAAKAKSEFEEAATNINNLLTSADDIFQVAERPGWDALTGVMTREWNALFMPAAFNNVVLGLGGIKSEDQLAASYHSYIKPDGYIGQRFTDHFTTMTNDPSAGYWLDGLPYSIDPRAYQAFIIPGDFNNPNFNAYPSWANDAKVTQRDLLNASGGVQKTIDAAFTWNATSNGDWGVKGSRNQLRNFSGTIPRLSHKFRASASKRIFFAPWETYFLLAEAAERGWTVPMGGQVAYENGIKASFDWWGVSAHLASYLTSTAYNRTGTSVSWNHTTEPGASHTMSYVDGYTNTPGTANILYPVNNLYKNGTVRNDRLAKIITQKYIAQTPWLPLETWSDHRRLGLPFFENPAIENPLVNMPNLTSSNYMTSQVKFFPQRVKYPSTITSSNPEGYQQAVGFLGAEDAVLTPLWWAKKP